MKALSQQLALPGQGFSIGDLMARLEETPSGDVEELRLFGELRDALTVSRHDCLGHNCPMFSRCYYELARVRAEKADIVVVNHALLAFNMVLDGQIVQPRDAIVIDEAHEFERYVIGALRLKLEYDQVPAFVNDTVDGEPTVAPLSSCRPNSTVHWLFQNSLFSACTRVMTRITWSRPFVLPSSCS